MTNPDAAQHGPVELWFVDLSASRDALDASERHTARLSSEDLKKISQGALPDSARERRAAYIALRILIERFWGPSWRAVPYTLTGSGKPTLEGLSGGFSLAHVDRFALVGLARASGTVAEAVGGEVDTRRSLEHATEQSAGAPIRVHRIAQRSGMIGVDLEPDRQPTVADDRRARIEDAAISIARGTPLPEPRQPRFLQAWVRLEAVAKADGRGIGRLLSGLGIIGADPSQAPGFGSQYATEIAAGFWVQDVVLGAGCVAAVALDYDVQAPPVATLPVTHAALEALLI